MEKIYTTNSPEETEAVGKMLAEELLLHAPQGALIAHFVLRRYKELDVELLGNGRDERGSYLL